MSDKTIFALPNAPQQFGVVLPPADLRQLDFSALDFDTLTRAGIEYIRTYFPNDFNDFYASNGTMMMLELVSYVGNSLSERADILVGESFLPTAQTKNAVIEHLALINQNIKRATPAVVDVQATISNVVPYEVRIAPGTRFTLTGPDQRPLYYEIFRSPGDFKSYISIPPGKKGVVAYGIEGMSGNFVSVTSAGGADQYVDIMRTDVLDEPIEVVVQSDSISDVWERIDVLEKSGPNDKVFEVKHLEDRTRILFGDNVAGQQPLSGQGITVSFRIGGGIRGRISAGMINETRFVPSVSGNTVSAEVLFLNSSPSTGGTDEETIDQAKKRAPRQYATHNNAATGEDYGLLASEYSHPVFGSVAKAIGIVRTGVDIPGASDPQAGIISICEQVRNAPTIEDAVKIMQTQFVNRNIVELYVLSEGPNNTPMKPNIGLKQGLINYLSEINVLTDEVRVYDGAIKAVNVNATVVISRNADAGTIKVAVRSAIEDFFNIRNFDMGTGMYLSNLYNILQDIPGIKYVNIFNPADDIIPTNKLGDPSVPGIGFNELITLGSVDLQFYFEPGNFRVPPSTSLQ